MTDLWTEASTDHEAVAQQRRLVAARAAVVPTCWPFLAKAVTPTDYMNRKALISDQIDASLKTMAEGVDFAVLRAEVEASLDADFDVLRRDQQATEQMAIASRRRKASLQSQAMAITCNSCGHKFSRSNPYGSKSSRCPKCSSTDLKQSAFDFGNKDRFSSKEERTAYYHGRGGNTTYSDACGPKGDGQCDGGLYDEDNAEEAYEKYGDSECGCICHLGWDEDDMAAAGVEGLGTVEEQKKMHEWAWANHILAVKHATIDDPQHTFTLNPADEFWIGNFSDAAIDENIRFWSSDEGKSAQPNLLGYDTATLQMFEDEKARRTGSKTAAQKSARDLTVGDKISQGTVAKVDSTTTPGSVAVWVEGEQDNAKASAIFNQGDPVTLSDATAKVADRGTPTCPECGSAAVVYSKAKSPTSECRSCGHKFDQSHAYDTSTNASKTASWWERYIAPEARVVATLKSHGISVSNVSGTDDPLIFKGKDSSGAEVKFRVTEKDAADLKSVMLGDLAQNFSGVDIEQSDIVTEGSKTAAKPPARVAGEGAYITQAHDSTIKKDVPAGAIATPQQGYQTWTGQRIYDWSVEGFDGDGWQLGGSWSEQGTASKTAADSDRSLSEIAQEIRSDWGSKVNYGAVPYLEAMESLDKITDNYYADSASSIVAYFLGNAQSWRGETAKRVKAELNAMLKQVYGSRHQAVADGEQSFCRICGVQMEAQDHTWYALSASQPRRSVGKHYCLPARTVDWPGEFNAMGNLVPGEPGGGGGQYDAPAGTIFDAGANPIQVSGRRRHQASDDVLNRIAASLIAEAGDNPFAKKEDTPADPADATKGNAPHSDGDPDDPADKKDPEQKQGDLDPSTMAPATPVTLSYTLTGQTAGEAQGECPGTFESFDGTTAFFTYEKGRFGVTNQGGKWVDAAGTEFAFHGDPNAAQPVDNNAAPAPDPTQQQPVAPKPPIGASKMAAGKCKNCTNGNHTGTNGTPGCTGGSCTCSCNKTTASRRQDPQGPPPFAEGEAKTAGGEHTEPCKVCGATVYFPGHGMDTECDRCHTPYNAFGQQLRDDYAGNPSNFDDEIGDMEGYEMQHSHDGARHVANLLDSAKEVVNGGGFKNIDPTSGDIVPTVWKGDDVTGEGILLDAFTASMLVQVIEALNPENQAKILAMAPAKAVDICWKLVNKVKSSKTALAGDTVCPECNGRGHTDMQSADRGNHTYSTPCMRCGGVGWIRDPKSSPGRTEGSKTAAEDGTVYPITERGVDLIWEYDSDANEVRLGPAGRQAAEGDREVVPEGKTPEEVARELAVAWVNDGMHLEGAKKDLPPEFLEHVQDRSRKNLNRLTEQEEDEERKKRDGSKTAADWDEGTKSWTNITSEDDAANAARDFFLDRGGRVSSSEADAMDATMRKAVEKLIADGYIEKIDDGYEWPMQMGGSKTAMPNPVDLGVNIGDIFYSSWGYDQTNIDFYEVTALTGASIRVRPIGQEIQSSDGHGSDRVVPMKGAYRGEEMLKRISTGFEGRPAFTVNSYSSAWLWDGTPKRQTSSGWGH